jgi:hypothetical protein
MSKTAQHCEKWVTELACIGGVYVVRPDNDVVELYVGNVSPDRFDSVLFDVQMLACGLCNGMSWGTDGVGYDANKRGRFVSVMKCVPKRIARYLRDRDVSDI